MTDQPPSGPQVVAEIGANHDGSVATAHEMVDHLAEAGCKIVKFQIYTASELVADKERIVTWGAPARQKHEPVGAMFDRLSLPWEAYDELFEHARELGMEPFATPFSVMGLEKAMSLRPSMIKIASSDVGYHELLAAAAETGLPVVLSLGKSTLSEVDDAVALLEKYRSGPVTLLHCVASYPAPVSEANLRFISTLKLMYPEHSVGFSDHTMSSVASIVAVAMGAVMIERHVTINPDLDGPDHWFSLPISSFATFQSELVDAAQSVGDGRKRISPSESSGRLNATRSLVATRDLTTGDILTNQDLVALRPGTGIQPKLKLALIGLTLTQDISRGTPLQWEMFHANPASPNRKSESFRS